MCIVATDSWRFDNDTARNVIIFDVDNSRSHAVNRKIKFLVLREVPNFEINGIFGSSAKKFCINSNKANTKFCLSLRYNADNGYLFVSGKEVFKFKVDGKNVSQLKLI